MTGRIRRAATPAGPELEQLIQLLARLPGLGPRSARRAALHLVARRGALMEPLAAALRVVSSKIVVCSHCHNIDTLDPCTICRDPQRDLKLICVVAQVGDLWALERTASFRGRYHVLGGLLSALAGVGPEDLSIADLVARVVGDAAEEIILALSATVEGQTTAHYVADRLRSRAGASVRITQLAHGVPVGGELDYLDEGTLIAALGARQGF